MSTDKRTNAAVLRNRQRRVWEQRRRRQLRTRNRIAGTPERPRLAIYRSLGHIYAQVIDDSAGRTLASASTLAKDLRGKCPQGGNIAAAKMVGTAIAAAAKSRGVSAVVFDRRGYRYHGRVKAFAEAARAAGLSF